MCVCGGGGGGEKRLYFVNGNTTTTMFASLDEVQGKSLLPQV